MEKERFYQIMINNNFSGQLINQAMLAYNEGIQLIGYPEFDEFTSVDTVRKIRQECKNVKSNKVKKIITHSIFENLPVEQMKLCETEKQAKCIYNLIKEGFTNIEIEQIVDNNHSEILKSLNKMIGLPFFLKSFILKNCLNTHILTNDLSKIKEEHIPYLEEIYKSNLTDVQIKYLIMALSENIDINIFKQHDYDISIMNYYIKLKERNIDVDFIINNKKLPIQSQVDYLYLLINYRSIDLIKELIKYEYEGIKLAQINKFFNLNLKQNEAIFKLYSLHIEKNREQLIQSLIIKGELEIDKYLKYDATDLDLILTCLNRKFKLDFNLLNDLDSKQKQVFKIYLQKNINLNNTNAIKVLNEKTDAEKMEQYFYYLCYKNVDVYCYLKDYDKNQIRVIASLLKDKKEHYILDNKYKANIMELYAKGMDNKINLSPYLDDYTYPQLNGIFEAIINKIPLNRILVKTNTQEQMNKIIELEKYNKQYNNKIDIDNILTYDFNIKQIRQLILAKQKDVDITPMLNKNYTSGQMAEIRLGLIQKVDVTKYTDEKLTPEEMKEIRLSLMTRTLDDIINDANNINFDKNNSVHEIDPR